MTDRVEMFLGEALDEAVDLPSWKHDMAQLISAALVWRQFKTYPRHRWKGCDEAACDSGLPFMFHDVLNLPF